MRVVLGEIRWVTVGDHVPGESDDMFHPSRDDYLRLAMFDYYGDKRGRSLRRAVNHCASADAVHLWHRPKLSAHDHVFGIVIEEQMPLRG